MTKPDKREEIVRAALELIAEHGFHGAPMAMIAERADVGAGTIYRYFENKDALITGAWNDLEERLMDKVLEGYPEQGSVREKFMHLARGLVKQWISSPTEFRFLEQFA